MSKYECVRTEKSQKSKENENETDNEEITTLSFGASLTLLDLEKFSHSRFRVLTLSG